MHLGRRTFLAIYLLLFLLPLALPASAAQDLDTGRDVQVDVIYEYGGTPVSNTLIYFYRVGSIHSNGTVSLEAPYNGYPLDPSLLYSDPQQAAKLLHSYILLNRASPDSVLTTDSQGSARKNFRSGLYLIAPQKHMDSNGIFRSEPTLASLPYRASGNDPWSYQLTYQPKCAYTPTGRVGTRNLYVTKRWTQDRESNRPKEITVYLLRDNRIFQEVKLNQQNRWLYRWVNLSEYYDWRVVEKPVPGYTVSVTGNSSSVLLTNTGTEETPDETEPTETQPENTEPGETTVPTETTQPTTPSETTQPTTPTTPSQPTTPPTGPNSHPPGRPSGGGRPRLPQTGVLWWPVPLLLCLGFALILLGIRIRRGADYEE